MFFLLDKQADLRDRQVSHEFSRQNYEFNISSSESPASLELAQTDAGTEHELDTHRVSGLPQYLYNTPPKTLGETVLELGQESLLEAHDALPQKQESSLEQRLVEEIRTIISIVLWLQLQDLVALCIMCLALSVPPTAPQAHLMHVVLSLKRAV
jgi:hypothetical protein